MKERLLDLFYHYYNGSASYDKIARSVKINTAKRKEELATALNELVSAGILVNKNNEYKLLDEYEGVISVNNRGSRSIGFVKSVFDDDIKIDAANLNGALTGDTVKVDVLNYSPRPSGVVTEVVTKSSKKIIGEYVTVNGKAYIKPDHASFSNLIKVAPSFTNEVNEGYKVVAIYSEKRDGSEPEVDIERIIGHKSAKGTVAEGVVYEHDFEIDFPDAVMDEVANIPMEVMPNEYSNRADLRQEMIYTIDGNDTKDIDDAVGVTMLPNGNYRLITAIADVSHYVKEGMPLYEEALKRGTSVYLVDMVIPMLPPELSNGICSLNPNVDRLSLVCEMEITSGGQVIKKQIYRAVICSKKQMTYESVNKIFNDNIVPEGYEPYVENLKLLQQLGDILRQDRIHAGYIEFASNEAKIIVNKEGKVTAIEKRNQGQGEKLIENLMVITNQSVAELANEHQVPVPFRIHDVPNEDRLKDFLAYISNLGYDVGFNPDQKLTSLELQNILKLLSQEPNFMIFSNLLLRCMAKAKYAPTNIGHFALALNDYCHYTSPIRRFPDLTFHRLYKKYVLDNQKISADERRQDKETLSNICEVSSERERAAQDCERDVNSIYMAMYMSEHLGEEFMGYISDIAPKFMYITLPNLIEGRVSVYDISDFKYYYDTKRKTISCPNTNEVFRMGDAVKVKATKVNIPEGNIDFMIVRDNTLEKRGISHGKKKKKKK